MLRIVGIVFGDRASKELLIREVPNDLASSNFSIRWIAYARSPPSETT